MDEYFTISEKFVDEHADWQAPELGNALCEIFNAKGLGVPMESDLFIEFAHFFLEKDRYRHHAC